MEPTKTDVPPKPSIRPPAAANEKPDYPTAQLSKIQFGLLSTKEALALSVIREKDARNSRVGILRAQDLFDPRLGVPCKEQKCATCNGTKRGACDAQGSCDGHFGHIHLAAAIYHPHFVRKCLKILSSICLGCSRVLEKKKRKNDLDALLESCSDEDEDEDDDSSAFKRPARKRTVGANRGKASRKRKRTENSHDFQRFMQGLENHGLQSELPKQEWPDADALDSSNLGLPHASVKPEPMEFAESSVPFSVPDMPRQGSRTSKPSNDGQPEVACKYCSVSKSRFPKIKVKLFAKSLGRRGKVETIQLVAEEKADGLPDGFWDFVGGHPTNFKDNIRTLLPCEALNILKKIPEDEVGKLHMDKVVSCPASFIVTDILVSPNCNRLVMEDWSSTMRPRVLERKSGPTVKLESLVRKAKYVHNTTTSILSSYQKPEYDETEQDSEDLQLLAARHLRACKVVEYKMTTGQEIEETGGSLELKWLKANVLAKRSNYSARSVINGDPCILIEEIGIPKEIATRLTVDEKVNFLNIRRWQKFVDEYMICDNKSMPGALSVYQKNKEPSPLDLEVVRTTKSPKIQLSRGDKITRCLKDGDRVFVNRPPSLHKHSLISLKVKIHDLSTIAINPLICPPFDADFDGDSFHVFVPQSLESRAETEELMTVPAQLLSSQGGQPIIGLTQDTLVAGHLLTSGHVFLSRNDMQQLSMWCSSKIPIPAIVKSPTKIGPLWTGKQLFSMTLPGGLAFGSLHWTGTPLGQTAPNPINSPEGDVLIQDGELLICQGEARWLDRSPNGVVRVVCDHAGPLAAVEHLNYLQAVLHQWLLIRGFSVGLVDFFAAEDPCARKRMLKGVQKSLEKSNEASLKQALKLDRQVQHITISPAQGGMYGSGDVEEHQGCFGLLLDNRKSNHRVAALQGAAIERFQTLAPDIENLVTGYMDKNNSLLAMVKSGSKGSFGKLTQQVGCLGLQLYKGERLLPVRSSNKLSYYQKSLDTNKADVFRQTEADARQDGFWESRGIIRSSYLDGLNLREFFMDSISSRCNVLRQGIEEPNQILKNLMLFMRDMKIEYDGTVRSGSDRKIIQFRYGPGKGCFSHKDPNMREEGYPSANGVPVDYNLEGHWSDSELAGEPVGVVAATSISEPAYNVRMQSIHQAQVLGTGPVQLLKEVLMVRSKTKLKLNDRRSILRLPQGFGKERRALEIQTQLQKVILEKITLISSIHFKKLDEKLYVKNELDKEGLSKPFVRLSPWVGHLQLCKRTVDENKLDINSIVKILNRKHSGGATEDCHDIYFAYSAKCICDEVHPQSEGLCIVFFPVKVPESVASAAKEVGTENEAPLLESMKNSMLPAVLNTAIRGSESIERVRIFWENVDSASRLPRESTAIGQHVGNQGKRYDKGELAIDVVLTAPKGAGKRGAAWNALKEACIPVTDLIDWSRSCPFAIQEIYTAYGVEAARHNILKRLSLATKTMGKPVYENHVTLVADTMTHCGDVTGLGLAGYREFCRQMSMSAPFTEASFQQPKKTFIDAAAGGASETIDGVLTSAVWGSRVPIGTGIAFHLKPKVPNMASLKWTGDPLDLWEETRDLNSTRKKGSHRKSTIRSQTELQKGDRTDSLLQALEDWKANTILKDGKLASFFLAKGNAKATIFHYGNQEDMREECDDETTVAAVKKAFPDVQEEEEESLEITGKDTKRHASRHDILQDDKHEGCNETDEQVEHVLCEPAIDNGNRTGCTRAQEKVDGAVISDEPLSESAIDIGNRTGCKRAPEKMDGAVISDEPLSKLQKKRERPNSWPMESDASVLRVNDSRRVTLSGCADVALKEEPKVECICDSYKLPQISSEEVSEEIIAPKADEVSEENIAPASGKLATNSIAKNISPTGDTSLASGDRRLWSGKVTNIVKSLFGNLFYTPNGNGRDTHEQEILPEGSDSGKYRPEIAGGTSQSTEEVLYESFGQEVKHLSPAENISVGTTQSDVSATDLFEKMIKEERKVLQNLLHIRYLVGEKVPGDIEKMILEEVLVHHPEREEKVGCGVDHIKVDYHPEHPTSKCFHIVRKDGSCSDFSFHKCLDTKLLKLCNSTQK